MNGTVRKGGRPPGQPKTGGGSRAGVPNKITADARKAIASFVDGNAHRLEGWLDRVAEENPAKAFELFQSVIEYNIPKLARTEHTGENGGPVRVASVEWTVRDAGH
jgi:hypothetical protein